MTNEFDHGQRTLNAIHVYLSMKNEMHNCVKRLSLEKHWGPEIFIIASLMISDVIKNGVHDGEQRIDEILKDIDGLTRDFVGQWDALRDFINPSHITA